MPASITPSSFMIAQASTSERTKGFSWHKTQLLFGLLSFLALSSSVAVAEDVHKHRDNVAGLTAVQSDNSLPEIRSAPTIPLWSFQESLDDENMIRGRHLMAGLDFKNPRFANLTRPSFFKFSTDHVRQLETGHEVSFQIPVQGTGKDGVEVGQRSSPLMLSKKCVLKADKRVIPAVAFDRQPTLQSFWCSPGPGEEFSMIFNTAFQDGMSALYYDKEGHSYYIDAAVADSDVYVLYDTAYERRNSQFESLSSADEMSEHLQQHLEESFADLPSPVVESLSRSSLRQTTNQAMKFRIFFVMHSTYCDYFGNNVANILVGLGTLLARVNGIFGRELGVFFELSQNIEDGICVVGSTDPACLLLSKNALLLRLEMDDFIQEKGISYDSFDMAHGLTNQGGGFSTVQSLCREGFKEFAASGFFPPTSDILFVGFYAHELAHQLGAAHSFRDCGGSTDNALVTRQAVEPGSGSTITAYSGLCGDKNVQVLSDPYFHNFIQDLMYDYVSSRFNEGCGVGVDIPAPVPVVTAPASCQVPIGNYFQLRGTTSTTDAASVFFSWDRSDNGFEDFNDPTLGKFRSYIPTSSQSRFFPNLHFLNFESDQNVEGLPTIARTMDFIFTERLLYDTTATQDTFDVGVMGHFANTETTVHFVDVGTEGHLKLLNPSSGSVLQSGGILTIQWSASADILPISGTHFIEILIAENTMEEVQTFEYDLHNKELQWIKLGDDLITSGEFTVRLPVLSTENSLDVNLMIRGSSIDDDNDESREECFFFDLATGITLLPSSTTDFDPLPTRDPTPFPTLRPSVSPSTSPSLSPTKFPTESPTISPTFGPTGSPTLPTRQPTDRPTLDTTNTPTAQPTELLTTFVPPPTTSVTFTPNEVGTSGLTAGGKIAVSLFLLTVASVVIGAALSTWRKKRKRKEGLYSETYFRAPKWRGSEESMRSLFKSYKASKGEDSNDKKKSKEDIMNLLLENGVMPTL